MTHDEDAETAVAAAAIEDLLYLVPAKKRAAARKDREKHGEFRMMSFAEIGFDTSPGLRYWNEIMQFKARAICTFVRDITNNHSAEDASRLLFRRQPDVSGSGYLEEYIDDLPREVA
jgi:hypothetical protein